MSEETKDTDAPVREAARRRRHPAVRWALRIVLSLLLIAVAAIASLYIPGVPARVLRLLSPSIEKSLQMRIEAADIELKFPCTLTVDHLVIYDLESTGDTMIAARHAELDISPAQLLRGRLALSDGRLADGLYRMGGPDSLYLNINIDSAGLSGNMDIARNRILIDRTEINGGHVNMILGPDTTTTPPDTTAMPLEILLGPVRMRNVLYTMCMSTTNDTIAAAIREASLSSGRIWVADTVELLSGTVDFTVDSALYGTRGALPVRGIDFSRLTMKNAEVQVDSFFMHSMDLRVPITSLRTPDFAGMPLEGSGVYSQNDSMMFARNVDLTFFGSSRILLDADMGFETDSLVPVPIMVDATARMLTPFLAEAFPSTAAMLAPLPSNIPLDVRARMSGTMNSLRIDTLGVSMPAVFTLQAAGSAANFDSIALLKADITLRGSLENPAPFASMMPQGVKLPPLALAGRIHADGSDYAADLTATTARGRLALKGTLRGSAPDYCLDLRANSFPVRAFMPDMGIGAVSGSLKASGRSLDLFRPGAALRADASISRIDFGSTRLGGIDLTASLSQGDLNALLESKAEPANLSMTLNGKLMPKALNWQLNANVRRLDLHALGMSDSIFNASMCLRSEGYATLALDSVSADAVASNLALNYGAESLSIDSISARARAGSQTLLTLGSHALNLDFLGREPLEPTLTAFSRASDTAFAMIDARNLDADSLVAALPHFDLSLRALPGNPIEQYLKESGMSFNTLQFTARRDSSLRADTRLTGFRSGASMRIDTISASMFNADNRLLLNVDMHNRPGTFDEFASVNLRGSIAGNRGKFFIDQQNLQGETGYRLGFIAGVYDSIIGVQISPVDPIIAYKNWTVNEDNYVAVNPRTFHIHANLDARGAGSRLQLFTSNHSDSLSTEAPNDINLRISDIHIQDWLMLNPFAPPIAGDVNADLTIDYDVHSVSGSGTASITNLTYGKRKVGDFNLDMEVATAFGGAIHANLGLDVNGRRAFTAVGAINDTTLATPVNMFLRVKEFPLDIANPFLPESMARLSGTINGRMDVTGRLNALQLNGAMNFSRARIDVGMLGSAFTLDSVEIPVDANIVRFNDFDIFGSNDNPLKINGTVNLRRFADPRIDLDFNAANMQVINSRKKKGVDIFGRAFIDLAASVKGSMKFLNVKAKLALLPQTNVTYQMSDAEVAAGLQPQEDVVRFVNFADTAQVAVADSVANSSMLMMVSALLDIRQGSQFTVNLSSDGTNRAVIKGQGILDYSQSPIVPDGRLTGRFTLDNGNFRYSLPVISEMNFALGQGSYIAFNGPVLNPVLNISASEELKANVTAQGQNSRLVNFIIGVNVTGTFEKMNVAFDLSTKDDITVQNELQTMSPTQRANQAMNLMLYGIYSGQGTTGNANLSGLYGFLTSQLNSWAANTIKGVDLSFGVDQFDRTFNGSKSTTTQYSYQLSKSLFNDRFKIVVGGNYSTDADAEENFAQNLISDVSFEYMLNQSGSMYVRLFRHTGYESILEGEVTQTGVGFVVRRKIRRVADIFNFIKAARQ